MVIRCFKNPRVMLSIKLRKDTTRTKIIYLLMQHKNKLIGSRNIIELVLAFSIVQCSLPKRNWDVSSAASNAASSGSMVTSTQRFMTRLKRGSAKNLTPLELSKN